MKFEGGKTDDFQEAERRYAELKRQFDAGAISVIDFNAERQRLMVQDEEGRWWARSPDNDEWNYYDGSGWVPATSPSDQEVIPEPTNAPTQTPVPPHLDQEAERRYVELKRQFDAGAISVIDFNAERQRLMVHDDEGHWWARSPDNGEWNYYDGNTWVPATSPSNQAVIPEPTNLPTQTPSPPYPKGVENRKNGRRRMPLGIPVAGLVGIMLVGIVLIGWVLVPYLRGEREPTFDSAFVHHATPENISSRPAPNNSTYIDNPLTNGNPNAILYVTQNWNPGGSGSIYNDHPIGVWYDSKRKRWAIFNQDKEPMPVGAAFNVAVLKEPRRQGSDAWSETNTAP